RVGRARRRPCGRRPRPGRGPRLGRRGAPAHLGTADPAPPRRAPAAGERQDRPDAPAGGVMSHRPDETEVVWSLPMRVRFRGIDVREGVLLRGADGGWGEWSPFLDYDAPTSEPWLRCAEEAVRGDWPAPVRDRVPVNVTIPAVDPERAAELVRARPGFRTAKVGVAERGQTLADDEARVAAVRDALGPGGAVRIDVNGGWSVDEAVRAIAVLDRAAGGLEYVEQPCASVEDLAAVRRRVEGPSA